MKWNEKFISKNGGYIQRGRDKYSTFLMFFRKNILQNFILPPVGNISRTGVGFNLFNINKKILIHTGG